MWTEGGPKSPTQTRIPLIPETRVSLKPVQDESSSKSNHKFTKKSNIYQSRTQGILQAASSLRKSIERLRSRTIKTAQNLRIIQACAKPPDPGITAPNGDFKRKFDEEEESKSPFLYEEEKLQAFQPGVKNWWLFNGRNRPITISLLKFVRKDYIFRRFDPQFSRTQFVIIQIPSPVLVSFVCCCLMAMVSGNQEGGRSEGQASPFRRRAGKETANEAEGEKRAVIINMSDARKTMRPRFFAVGLFLSVLLVNSRQLIEHMKRVWRIRGEFDANPLQAEEGHKFIFEFSEERDRQHVVRGGPW
jgi:hypothetical protein